MEILDLHIHTNQSDGSLNIDEIINLSLLSNCHKIAITDHEKIFDYSSYETKYPIKIINGIEFNSEEKGLHILGYGPIHLNPIVTVMEQLEKENEKVCLKLIEALLMSGYDISIDKLEKYLESIGLNNGAINKRKIVKYLIYKGYTKNVIETYNTLIGKGQQFYFPSEKLSSKEIIELINKCHGVPILAHPSTLKLQEQELIKKIKELLSYGLEGIEVINSKNSFEEIEIYKNIAKRLNIISTVGSDFHSQEFHNIGIAIDEPIFENLIERINTKKKILKRQNMI